MTEFNLSKKIRKIEGYGNVIYEEDVKLFIRRLKEEVALAVFNLKLMKKIDKLAGDELIK